MVEQEPCIPEPFERRLWNELLIMKTAEKTSAHDHAVSGVTLWNRVEILRLVAAWILSNNQAA